MDEKVLNAVGPYKDYFAEEGGKVKCLVNGHCFPANRPEQIEAFVKGARFAKLKVRYDAEKALTKYEPFIVISKNFPHMLYCALTGQLLEKSMAAVKKHMGGKRFVKAKARFVEDKQDLKPEPSLREFGIILPGDEGEQGDRKSKRQRKGKGADGDEEMREADGDSDEEEGESDEGESDEGESDEGERDEEPTFWVPPGEGAALHRGRKARRTGEHDEEDDKEEEDEEEEGDHKGKEDNGERQGPSGSDRMDEDEEAADVGTSEEKGKKAGPSGRATKAAGYEKALKTGAQANGSAGPGSHHKGKPQGKEQQQQPQHQAQKRPLQHFQKGRGKQQQQQQQLLEQQRKKVQQHKEQTVDAGGQQQQQPPAAGTAKDGKLSKRQMKKLAAAAAAAQAERATDDFDFDVDANGGEGAGMDEAPQQGQQSKQQQEQQQPGGQAGAASSKPAKKNVNRPAPAKRARQ